MEGGGGTCLLDRPTRGRQAVCPVRAREQLIQDLPARDLLGTPQWRYHRQRASRRGFGSAPCGHRCSGGVDWVRSHTLGRTVPPAAAPGRAARMRTGVAVSAETKLD